MKKICVIGSLNVDLTLRLPRFHAPGETITALAFDTYTGGKGGNQAVAAAKLGAQVIMVGKVGEDQNGALYKKVLNENHIDLRALETVAHTPTGTALIEVDQNGENRIAVVPGTNALVDQRQIDDLLPVLLTYDIFLFQLETPMETVEYAAKILCDRGKIIILDPAPAVALPPGLYPHVNYLTPNSTELSILAGMPINSLEDVEKGARALIARGAKNIVAKLGAQGCFFANESTMEFVPGFQVKAVDTTAAGDSFNAGLAVGLAQNMTLKEALGFANAVGALAVTGAGAQGAMPSMKKLEQFLKEQRQD